MSTQRSELTHFSTLVATGATAVECKFCNHEIFSGSNSEYF